MVPEASHPVPTLVFFLVVFVAVGVVFLFIHLLMGSMIRPSSPDPEKLTIYECGEPTVGSAWIQFDLRFYVVALLFVIFDVEVAFFFPWATVFGKANQLANPDLPEARRQELSGQLLPAGVSARNKRDWGLATYEKDDTGKIKETAVKIKPAEASAWAHIAFWDLFAFFAILLVGFAYVWRRGDIDWVRAYMAHKEPAAVPEKPLEQHTSV
ncbi:MAG: NADH-quinone oxidoreductase subunit A [Planctomycetes bacterium]|nr:NADH-quinone oxidoreductase subunit A [Planctomycetota bacterium]